MSTSTIEVRPARPGATEGSGHAHFGHLLRSEWTKFRTVRGWVIGMMLAAVLMVFVGRFAAGSVGIGCVVNGVQKSGKACVPPVTHGPGGEVVTDSFNFAHQSLTGNGTITARVISLTGKRPDFTGSTAQAAGPGPKFVPGLMAWSKAGLIIKQNLHQGSAYAAMLVTGANGVRMQYNYTGDVAGLPGTVSAAHPRWLRLTRAGDEITGYDSADGVHWTKVGAVELAGLPATVQVGMFAASPNYAFTSNSFGGEANQIGPSEATGVFDHVTASGTPAGGRWAVAQIGGGGPVGPGSLGPMPVGGGGGGRGPASSGFTAASGTFKLAGSGDIAPVVPGPASTLPTVTIEQSLVGTFIGLIAIVVVAVMFFTTEYRRGLIRTTLAATPRRGLVLAAKSVVIAAATFVVGLVAAAVAIAVGVPAERNSGQVLLTVSTLTEARVMVGTAAMLAVAAVFATALGAVLRRSGAAIAVAIVAIVLPFLLVALNVFPSGISSWLLRLTPAAGLAVQQSIPLYRQVANAVDPARGIYPLSPLAGFAVLCCWAAAAMALAVVLLRRRDA
jgi:ABC-type transport system involved in multi-copper enzyme maturation permease subunit